uniref:Uncharacterized protein n=1 Tax=viral metagenome TaxID=1070528 RepID=A0A6M3LPH9_9ZZZZ
MKLLQFLVIIIFSPIILILLFIYLVELLFMYSISGEWGL